MPETKRKLTLTVDAETVEAAKKLDLNISEVTEKVLRGYTLDAMEAEKGATREQYKDLLATMDPLLTKYGCRIVVGECREYAFEGQDDPVYFSGGAHLYTEQMADQDQVVEEPVPLTEIDFLRPNHILRNFFTAIESVKSQRREEVESLLLAKKLVDALNEQEARRARGEQQQVRTVTKKGGRRK